MSKNVLFLALTYVVLIATSGCYAWMTNFDAPFVFQCPDNQVLKSLESIHDNGKEDRAWSFACGSLDGDTTLSQCEWSGYVNGFDQEIQYQCPNDGVITGIDSYHDNGKEDRRYNFRCCTPGDYIAHACKFTGYVNNFDGGLNYRVPDGQALKGVHSIHDNGKEGDRPVGDHAVSAVNLSTNEPTTCLLK